MILSTSNNNNEETVDQRLARLYPCVDERVTPLPRGWSNVDKEGTLGLSHDNVRLTYRGAGENPKDAAAARTGSPIPAACGVYYFEVKIVSKGRDGYMGIGLCTGDVSMNRLPGWDPHSYGYHGDDGYFFCSSGTGTEFGPTFTTGDVIGCGYRTYTNSLFFTKNGRFIDEAQTDLPRDLYPTVGLQTPGEVADTNFGQTPFMFNIEEEIAEAKLRVNRQIHQLPLPMEKTDWFNSLIASYLAHQGYGATAEAFSTAIADENTPALDMQAHRTRQRINKLVLLGRISDAISAVKQAYPDLLENNPSLHFMLKCRQFIEMIAGVDVEQPRSAARSTSSSPAHSRSHTAPYSIGKAAKGQANGHSSGRRTRSSAVRAPHANGAANHAGNNNNDVQDMDCSPSSPASASNGDTSTTNGSASTVENGDAGNVMSPLTMPHVQFGRELRAFSQTLMPPNNARLIERMTEAFSLIAYSDPWSSPNSHILSPKQREAVAQALNTAILQQSGGRTQAPLDQLYDHAVHLRRTMVERQMGAHAFADHREVIDVFRNNTMPNDDEAMADYAMGS